MSSAPRSIVIFMVSLQSPIRACLIYPATRHHWAASGWFPPVRPALVQECRRGIARPRAGAPIPRNHCEQGVGRPSGRSPGPSAGRSCRTGSGDCRNSAEIRKNEYNRSAASCTFFGASPGRTKHRQAGFNPLIKKGFLQALQDGPVSRRRDRPQASGAADRHPPQCRNQPGKAHQSCARHGSPWCGRDRRTCGRSRAASAW